jgi:hypothetical protein
MVERRPRFCWTRSRVFSLGGPSSQPIFVPLLMAVRSWSWSGHGIIYMNSLNIYIMFILLYINIIILYIHDMLWVTDLKIRNWVTGRSTIDHSFFIQNHTINYFSHFAIGNGPLFRLTDDLAMKNPEILLKMVIYIYIYSKALVELPIRHPSSRQSDQADPADPTIEALLWHRERSKLQYMEGSGCHETSWDHVNLKIHEHD